LEACLPRLRHLQLRYFTAISCQCLFTRKSISKTYHQYCWNQQVLAKKAQELGTPFLFDHQVDQVDFSGDKVDTIIQNIKTGATKKIESEFVIDASGYGRVLPRLLDLSKPLDFPPRGALFAHISDNKRPRGKVGSLITFLVPKQDLWVWIIPFSNGYTSIGFNGDLSYFQGFDPDVPTELFWRLLLEQSEIRERFRNEKFLFDPRLIEGYAIGIKRMYGKGFVLTGNASEFLDPIFSSGVTFALQTGAMAARLVAKQIAGSKVDWQKEYEDPIRNGTEVFKNFVEAWYDGTLQEIFFSDYVETHQMIKRQLCSVLSGHVWDQENPFVSKPTRSLRAVYEFIKMASAN